MKTYNFKKFTNAQGVEKIKVFYESNKLFSIDVCKVLSKSKADVLNDHIYFEASLKGEEAENLYAQLLNSVNN